MYQPLQDHTPDQRAATPDQLDDDQYDRSKLKEDNPVTSATAATSTKSPDDVQKQPARLGLMLKLSMALSFTALAFAVVFISWLWFASVDDALWRGWALAPNRLSLSVTITSLVIRAAVGALSASATSMAASAAVERRGVRLPAVARVSMARFASASSLSLANLALQGSILESLVRILVLFLLLTTLISQFTSTLLFADLEQRRIVSFPQIPLSAYCPVALDGADASSDPILSHRPSDYWREKPRLSETYAEYTEPSLKADGVDDTGPTIRAFLPFMSQEARETLQEFYGVTKIVDSRITCVRPRVSNLRLSGSSEGIVVSGTARIDGLALEDALGSMYPVSADFSCQSMSPVEPGYVWQVCPFTNLTWNNIEDTFNDVNSSMSRHASILWNAGNLERYIDIVRQLLPANDSFVINLRPRTSAKSGPWAQLRLDPNGLLKETEQSRTRAFLDMLRWMKYNYGQSAEERGLEMLRMMRPKFLEELVGHRGFGRDDIEAVNNRTQETGLSTFREYVDESEFLEEILSQKGFDEEFIRAVVIGAKTVLENISMVLRQLKMQQAFWESNSKEIESAMQQGTDEMERVLRQQGFDEDTIRSAKYSKQDMDKLPADFRNTARDDTSLKVTICTDLYLDTHAYGYRNFNHLEILASSQVLRTEPTYGLGPERFSYNTGTVRGQLGAVNGSTTTEDRRIMSLSPESLRTSIDEALDKTVDLKDADFDNLERSWQSRAWPHQGPVQFTPDTILNNNSGNVHQVYADLLNAIINETDSPARALQAVYFSRIRQIHHDFINLFEPGENANYTVRTFELATVIERRGGYWAVVGILGIFTAVFLAICVLFSSTEFSLPDNAWHTVAQMSESAEISAILSMAKFKTDSEVVAFSEELQGEDDEDHFVVRGVAFVRASFSSSAAPAVADDPGTKVAVMSLRRRLAGRWASITSRG
ncbi:hypothetical protein K456DRAFT_1723771 [Colletotrichum gloeosporioides 23]|nr:hypothetical protein K456DRAFT_1723771 [Colletotrichum gloeosporioides 23]